MNLRTSWDCHKCRAVNAPHVDQCACSTVSAGPVCQPFVNPVYPLPATPNTLPGTWPVFPGSATICGHGQSNESISGVVAVMADHLKSHNSDNLARFVFSGEAR